MNENWSKSEKLLLGKWTDGKPELPEGLGWGKLGLKYLGVFLGDELTVAWSRHGKGKGPSGEMEMVCSKDVIQREHFNYK